MMLRLLRTFTFAWLWASLIALFEQPAVASQLNIPGQAQQIWDDFKFNLLALHSYQPGCEPTQIRPAEGTSYQGVIILLHGFTSCPKQFFQMADSLSKRGFHVLIPTLPGHGRAGVNEIDEQESLPGAKNWFLYGSFARWLNALAMSVAHGQVHIGGLCLGATIAMQAMQLEPALYTRGLLLSPFFEVSTPLLGRLGRWVGRVGDAVDLDWQLRLPIALQDNHICENIERKIHGRSGYCRVRLTHLIGVARYAFDVKKNLHDFSDSIQTLIVENDEVASPQSTLKVMGSTQDKETAHSHTCVLNEKVTHSMFSPTDLPLPKPWLPELHNLISEFFAHGTPAAQRAASGYFWPQSKQEVNSCSLFPVEFSNRITADEQLQ